MDPVQTITVAAVHQSSRVVSNISVEDKEQGRGPRNGEKSDERRVLVKGVSGQELDMDQLQGGQPRGSSSSSGHRPIMLQQSR